ncbi:hypothetical protein [Brevundimonas sp. LjRoot202]|uniref:hypothetical protein n=1 Tax=Brevundimonas sp. LjRoot202 TaxID=3342281 RepID=UPI003ECC5E64
MSAGDEINMLPWLSLGLAILVQTGVVAFFGGKLAQRMTSAEKRLTEQDSKIEKKIGDQTALLITVAEMGAEQKHTTKALEKLAREMEGAHRQLANIATDRIGVGGELR